MGRTQPISDLRETKVNQKVCSCKCEPCPDHGLKTKTERLSVFGSALFYGGSNPPWLVWRMRWVRIPLQPKFTKKIIWYIKNNLYICTIVL